MTSAATLRCSVPSQWFPFPSPPYGGRTKEPMPDRTGPLVANVHVMHIFTLMVLLIVSFSCNKLQIYNHCHVGSCESSLEIEPCLSASVCPTSKQHTRQQGFNVKLSVIIGHNFLNSHSVFTLKALHASSEVIMGQTHNQM